MDTRGKLILQKLKDRERLEYLEQPSHDTTKNTTPQEREKALFSFTGWISKNERPSDNKCSAQTNENPSQPVELIEPHSTSDSLTYYNHIVSAFGIVDSLAKDSPLHLYSTPNESNRLNDDPATTEMCHAPPTILELNPIQMVAEGRCVENVPFETNPSQEYNLDSPEFPTTVHGQATVERVLTDHEYDSDSSSTSSVDISGCENLNISNSLLEQPSISTTASLFEATNNVTVPKPSIIENHRINDKKNACFYCHKLFSKLPQHLERSHSDKHEVAALLSLPKGDKLRADRLKQLRNKGNYIHNMDVLKRKDGSLIVSRRSAKDLDYTNYLPCEFCHGFFHKIKLWRHLKKCPENGSKQNTSKQSRSVISSAFLLTPLDQYSSKLFHEQILNTMLAGPTKSLIQSDKTLCAFGSKEMEKHRFLPHLKNQISFKIRLLARLVLELRKSYPNFTVAHCVLKEHFDKVVSVTSKISIGEGKPSLGKKIGHSLKKCATIVKNKAIVENNENLRKQVEDFLVLFQEEWKDRISIPSTALLHRRRYATRVEMPLPEDIIKLNKYILSKESEFISNGFEGASYTEVAKVVLTHIIVFNRRRAGEVSLMEIESYHQRTQSKKPEGEIDKILSQSEKKNFSKLEIVYLRGKKGSKVDCLLTPNMVKCMGYLLNNREFNGILKTNIYMFCLPYSMHCMRGHEALKEIAEKCDASMPVQLRSTKLRKHVSTVSQLLNLTDSDFNALCKHMGHNPNVHREYYQMNEETLLKTQISKILLSLEEGNVVTHRGKRLDEFEVNINDGLRDTFSNAGTEVLPSDSALPATEDLQNNQPYDSENSNSSIDSPTPSSKSTTTSKTKKRTVRTKWTAKEIKILNEFFTEEILIGKRPPTKKRCEDCIKMFPELQKKRSYLKIKWRVNSIIQENQKKKLTKNKKM